MSVKICLSKLTFNGKPVDNLTQEELKQALVLTYQESDKYKNLYFKALDAKAELMTDMINLKLEECKRLTTKNLQL